MHSAREIVVHSATLADPLFETCSVHAIRNLLGSMFYNTYTSIKNRPSSYKDDDSIYNTYEFFSQSSLAALLPVRKYIGLAQTHIVMCNMSSSVLKSQNQTQISHYN